jgi:hypothetical protein
MICKDNQNMIDTLLGLKDNSSSTINRIGSYEDSKKTTQCVNIINELMDNHKTQNKIASTQSTKGELAEFQGLLRSFTRLLANLR